MNCTVTVRLDELNLLNEVRVVWEDGRIENIAITAVESADDKSNGTLFLTYKGWADV